MKFMRPIFNTLLLAFAFLTGTIEFQTNSEFKYCSHTNIVWLLSAQNTEQRISTNRPLSSQFKFKMLALRTAYSTLELERNERWTRNTQQTYNSNICIFSVNSAQNAGTWSSIPQRKQCAAVVSWIIIQISISVRCSVYFWPKTLFMLYLHIPSYFRFSPKVLYSTKYTVSELNIIRVIYRVGKCLQ